MEDKKALRSAYIKKRKELHPEELEVLSERIAANFFSLSLGHVRYLHIYYPIPGKQEIDSLFIGERIRRDFKPIKLVLPKSDLRSCTLKHILWEDSTPLAMNAWGITEPLSGEEVSAETLDLIIIPLLACDSEGNRLGYGKGFYDRFLATCRQDALKVGLSYFEPQGEVIPHENHDIPLDLCVTPERIHYFKPPAQRERGNDRSG
ncbi:5-formyltetrahydrofolate cyclo-ligase [Arcticibacter sp.]|jgi:5-formyltetrahydrofolate cyclo-ligase|uniref:5-formyltetrahydrofolate cyclo-ligase n=1 Tax=Arcticibacter sp. TaxID=1872630 RepID=UPI00388E011B